MDSIKKWKKKYYNALNSLAGGFKEDASHGESSKEQGAEYSEIELGWKREHLRILSDIFRICAENNISIFLHGETALAAMRDETLSDYPAVCLDEKNIEDFIELIQNNDGIEVIGSAGAKQLIVHNPRTLDFNLERSRNLRLIGLHIRVLAIKPSTKSQLRKIEVKKLGKKYIKSSVYRYGDVKKHGKTLPSAIRAFMAVVPQEDLLRSGSLFKANNRSGETDFVLVDSKEYPRQIFEDKKTVTIDNKVFFIPANYEDYFSTAFGPNWNNKIIRVFKETNSAFRDSENSTEDFKAHIGYLDFNEYEDNKTMRIKHFYGDKEARVIQNRYKWMINRTHERFLLWHKYMPKKETIQYRFEKGDISWLRETLAEYIDKLKLFAEKEMTIFFDEEIFEITLRVLNYDGFEELSRKIRKLVPEEHKKPITIKDYDGNIVEHIS